MLVTDGVLDKLHPQLREHYRFEYQKSLVLLVNGAEGKDLNSEVAGVTLHGSWIDWYNAHKKEIQFPRRK